MNVASALPVSSREVLAGGMIKGGMMAAHIAYATKDRPAEQIQRFWNALAPALRRSLQAMILPIRWYEFSILVTVDRAIVDVYGGGDILVLREVGAYSARSNLTGVYKAYRRESIHDFLINGAQLHAKFQDFGSAEYVRSGPTSGKTILTRYTSYSPLFCESAIGYYREALDVHGARDIEVDETSCQCRGEESCTFDLRWR